MRILENDVGVGAKHDGLLTANTCHSGYILVEMVFFKLNKTLPVGSI